MALLVLLRELHERGELILDAVAHLIIGSGAQTPTVTKSSAAVSLPRWISPSNRRASTSSRPHVSSSAQSRSRPVHARRDFFARLKEARSAHCVATGHTQDDQAETVLLRMTRGTGVRGLGGIAPSRDGHRPAAACLFT